MSIFEKYVACLNRNDLEQITALFAEDCLFKDHAPWALVGKDVLLQGRESVRGFFEDLFTGHKVWSVLGVDMGKRAFYDVGIDKNLLRCVGSIQIQQGLIKEMEIRLRL